jgi:hypothetical protein
MFLDNRDPLFRMEVFQMFNWLLLPSIGMAIIGAMTTIRDSLFEDFLRWLWLGPVIDFIFAWYSWLWAIFITLFVFIRWRAHPYILAGTFAIVLLFFKFLLGF